MAIAEALMTAEEYRRMPDDGRRTELVRGRIVELPPPNFVHGQICITRRCPARAIRREHDLGRRRHQRHRGRHPSRPRHGPGCRRRLLQSTHGCPRRRLPIDYPDVAPDLVFEVRSPSDRWTRHPREGRRVPPGGRPGRLRPRPRTDAGPPLLPRPAEPGPRPRRRVDLPRMPGRLPRRRPPVLRVIRTRRAPTHPGPGLARRLQCSVGSVDRSRSGPRPPGRPAAGPACG